MVTPVDVPRVDKADGPAGVAAIQAVVVVVAVATVKAAVVAVSVAPVADAGVESRPAGAPVRMLNKAVETNEVPWAVTKKPAYACEEL